MTWHGHGHACVTAWASVPRRVSGNFIWNGFFNDTIKRHRCASITPQLACGRLLHTPTIQDDIRKWHEHERANASIEPRWMDVREVPMRWATRESILNGMTKRVVIADDIPRLEMMSRHMNHVDGDQDDKMRSDITLKDLKIYIYIHTRTYKLQTSKSYFNTFWFRLLLNESNGVSN